MAGLLSKFKKVKWKHFVNYIAVSILAILFTLLSLAGALPSSMLFTIEKILISIILAVSLSLVVGFLGELSLGHAGFMCIGAYMGGMVSRLLDETALGGDSILAVVASLIVGAAIAGVFGFIIGLPALRLKGDYLAIVTLAFGEIIKTIFENSSEETFGGPVGLSTPRFDKDYLLIIGFILVLLTLFVIQNLIRSKHGRAITAIRDNEIAARATGINVTKYKLVGFIVSAIFAGVAGVLYSYSNYTVSAAVFDYNYSIQILVMVVLGGMGSISGSIISASLITFLDIQLQSILGDFQTILQNQFPDTNMDVSVLKDIIYALVLILLVIYNNAASLKNFREKYNFKTLIDKIFRRKNDVADVTDDAARWDVVPTKIEMDEVISTDVIVTESVQTPDKGDNV